MKQHSEGFKEAQVSLGKEQDIIITYGNTTLTSENINSFRYSFEGNILKSIMTCIELETTENIPLNTKFNLQYGLKVGEEYEYLNFNNYIVYSSEKQEDKASYRIIAYDEMLDTMRDYEQVNIPYPCTIADYVQALATQLGYTYTYTSFPNDVQVLNGDYFVDAGYTYRDVLDDLAEVTASNIVIKNGELFISNSIETNEVFDDRFIKTTNADFRTYGPINAIVLSRSISDNIYAKDQESIEENGLFEIKISDNQIMNNIDRNQYISAIYNKLHGVRFTLYDFESVGIGYLEPLDKFSITIGETHYTNLICFNDSYLSSNGISESLHADEPIQSQTDYKKADTTDQRINQTNLIVDKQQQTITGLITNVEDNIEKVAELTQTVDGFSADIQQANNNANQARQQTAQLSLDVAELRSEIGDVVDITTTEEGYGEVDFENVNQSEPINITIHSMGADIKYLYPSETLYPGATLYPLSRTIIFENITTDEKTTYTIPDDLLWYSSTIYDEFYLDYETETCQITKRVGIDEYGQKYPLTIEEVVSYTYPLLSLADGDYKVYTPSYPSAYLKVRLMNKNPYTSQFATKDEMRSSISQSAREIETYVSNTYYLKGEGHTLESRVTQTEDSITSEVADRTQADSQLNSLITQNASAINLEVTARENLQTDYYNTKSRVASIELGVGELEDGFDSLESGVENLDSVKISKVSGKTSSDSVVSYINQSADIINLQANRLIVNSTNFKVTSNGTITATNGVFTTTDTGREQNQAKIKVTSPTATLDLCGDGAVFKDKNSNSYSVYTDAGFIQYDAENNISIFTTNGNVTVDGNSGSSTLTQTRLSTRDVVATNVGTEYIPVENIYYYNLYPRSLAESKKNFEKITGKEALEIINNTDIYKYNYKMDDDKDKKHIGVVIGDKFNYSKELTDKSNKGIDIYSLASTCLLAIKEQQAQIQQLKKEIEELKNE